MPKVIRWGIIGTGKVARDFARDLRLLSSAQLYAVASRKLEKAESFAREFKISKAYSSYQLLLEDENVDIVYIATPHQRHKDDCLLCLNAGKSVLCEKPFALNAEEAKEVIKVAREKQLFCMEAMWMRFMPLIQQVKNMIENKEIGNIFYFYGDFGYPVSFNPENRFFSPIGGGTLLDRGVYLLSLVIYLFGEPDTFKCQASFAQTGVDDQCSIIFQYSQGLQAIFFSTLKTYTNNHVIIIGDRGKIEIKDPFYSPYSLSIQKYPLLNHSNNSLQNADSSKGFADMIKQNSLFKSIYLRLKNYLPNRLEKTIFLPPQGKGYIYEAQEVIRCLNENKLESTIMPLDETLKIMQIIDNVRQKWKNNQ